MIRFNLENEYFEPNKKSEMQVGKFLAIQAFAKPHYLSLGFIEDSRIEEGEKLSEDDIKDLEKLDPLRRAFKLAEYAENATVHGIKYIFEKVQTNIETVFIYL